MVYVIQDLLYYWDNIGVFQFLLPFLLVFAIVYGILSYMQIFANNRAVHMILSIVVGLMATRFPFFNDFYQEIFPRLGIGITILLALLILIGLFHTKESGKFMPYVTLSIGAVIFIIILYQSFDIIGWTSTLGGYGGANFVAWLISAALLIGVIIAVAVSGGKDTTSQTRNMAYVPMYPPYHPGDGKP